MASSRASKYLNSSEISSSSYPSGIIIVSQIYSVELHYSYMLYTIYLLNREINWRPPSPSQIIIENYFSSCLVFSFNLKCGDRIVMSSSGSSMQLFTEPTRLLLPLVLTQSVSFCWTSSSNFFVAA